VIDKFSLRLGWWIALLSPVDVLVGLTACRPDPKKVLIVRLDGIGDFVLWLDAAKALRTLFPEGEYHLTLLGNDAWTPLAQDLGWFDDVLSLNLRRFVLSPTYRFRLMASIRRAGFGTVIHPTYSRELLCGDAVVRMSGAPKRIGSSGDLARTNSALKRISDGWYTHLLRADPRPLAEMERNAEFARQLGLPNFTPKPPVLPESTAGHVAQRNLPYYVLFPGAGYSYKQWPVERFAQIAVRIHHRTRWTGLVCGSGPEALLGQRLIELAGVPLENWMGRTSLVELAALIRKACLLVSNDTSAVHIAAAVGTRAVCVMGGGQFGRFLPYPMTGQAGHALPVAVYHPMDCFGCNWQCIYRVAPGSPKPCVANVTVDAVWDSVQHVLDETPAGSRRMNTENV
jgi:ADP-heptose:LPS heptosyltransferase